MPASISNLVTVLIETPQGRVIERRDEPSTSTNVQVMRKIAGYSRKRRSAHGVLAPPPFLCGFPGYFLAPLGAHSLGSRLAAHAAQGNGSGVLAIVGSHVLDLASRNLGDHD